MKVILMDTRASFRDDFRTRLLIDDDRNVELLTDLNSAAELDAVNDRFHPDIILVSDTVMKTLENRDLSPFSIVGYRTSKSALDVFTGHSVPEYGYVESATHLLNLLEMGLPLNEGEHTKETAQEPVPETIEDVEQEASQAIDADTRPAKPVKVPTTVPDPSPTPVVVPVPPVETVKSQFEAARAERAAKNADSILKRELEQGTSKTVTVAVYSAKGGVGKTTISAELAYCLALTSNGRANYRTCIIDYNIDFGNVLTVLNYDAKGKNLTFWAAEVRERLANGEAPEDIQYSRAEINQRLQQLDSCGLYALIAPITHEDSMDIESAELEIILQNIIQNGGFDFVVLDTGNNTRDSSVIALEAADYVLLVATQDVSTADCNVAFLKTMEKIGFDTNKVRLVVNSIMPYRYTQVTVEEVEKRFPFGCVARIKRNPDVVRANNLYEPLVLQPDHEFSAEICKIVAFLTGKEKIYTTKKTKPSLKHLFRRRGKEE